MEDQVNRPHRAPKEKKKKSRGGLTPSSTLPNTVLMAC